MNDQQLRFFIKHDGPLSAIKTEIFPSDLLPLTARLNDRPRGFIVNRDESHKGGSHWISIYFPLVGPPEYYDSYGLSPAYANWHIDQFIKLNSDDGHFLQINRSLQHPSSKICGLWALYFLYFRARNFSLQKILSWFPPTVKHLNDCLVYKTMMKIYAHKKLQGPRSIDPKELCHGTAAR